MKTSPVLVAGLILLSGLLVIPIAGSSAVVGNYPEGVWTNWTLITNTTIAVTNNAVCQHGSLVVNVGTVGNVVVTPNATVSLDEQRQVGSGNYPFSLTASKTGGVLYCAANLWNFVISPTMLANQTEAASAYGTYIVKGVYVTFSGHWDVDIFKDGTILKQIPTCTTDWLACTSPAVGISASGQYVVLVGPNGTSGVDLRFQVYQAAGTPASLPTGPQGATGPQGPQGPPGSQGAVGPSGTTPPAPSVTNATIQARIVDFLQSHGCTITANSTNCENAVINTPAGQIPLGLFLFALLIVCGMLLVIAVVSQRRRIKTKGQELSELWQRPIGGRS